MTMNFNNVQFTFSENLYTDYTKLSSTAGSAPWNSLINLYKRSDFDIENAYYSNWRYVHMIWDIYNKIDFYIDNKLIQTVNSAPSTTGLNLN